MYSTAANKGSTLDREHVIPTNICTQEDDTAALAYIKANVYQLNDSQIDMMIDYLIQLLEKQQTEAQS